MKDVEGMSILITGGGSGIGAATARYFVERGARVTICGRRKDKIEAVATSIGPACRGICADITVDRDRHELIEAAVAHGGGLDALVNNAGNMYRGAIDAVEEDKLFELFNTNVIAAMMLTGLAKQHLSARGGGGVIFIGSIHNRRAFPGASAYAATKGAIETLSRVLAAELGSQNIRVNCVAPGAVFTEINQRAGLLSDTAQHERLAALAKTQPIARVGEPEEVAAAIEYLLRAEWTTGTVIEVDGGLGLGLTNA